MTRLELDLLASRQKVEILELHKLLDEHQQRRAALIIERDRALSDLASETRKHEATEQSLKQVREQRDAMDADRRAAKKSRDETLAQFEELKTRLHAAERENQRLQGYIDRVYEDDVAREGFVEIPAHPGTPMMQPRRPSSLRACDQMMNTEVGGARCVTTGYTDASDRRSPRHRVNYGR